MADLEPLGVARALLFVKGMETMARFYGEVLGLASLPCDEDPAGYRLFDAGPVELALHVVPEPWASGIEIADPPVAREGAATKLVFRCDDLEGSRAELMSRNVAMGPIQSGDGLAFCDGVDPEGNVFQLSTRR
ncbi:MAG: VOC family protein [Myxococcota bacterium]|nr:VOC family protein [Myxococcota bacterium]